ncbi:MAG: hypothetical protein KAH10_09365, partial [Flavobacteriales bacterium]|nr:hypothetical protein [Flavobacteriales bacterium]
NISSFSAELAEEEVVESVEDEEEIGAVESLTDISGGSDVSTYNAKEIVVEKTVEVEPAAKSSTEGYSYSSAEEFAEEVKEETVPIERENISAEKAVSFHETIIPKKSLHDELKKSSIQIGLNDRIAFVKQLFAGDQQDFNRVLSQVNSFSSIDELEEFMENYVKPEHDWTNKEAYADRFMDIILAKFS